MATAALSFAQLRALAAGALPNASATALDVAAAVAMAESRGRTSAVSSTGDYGLWQINHRWHPTYDTARLLSDPAYNASAMAAISKGGTDWQPWTTFKTGAYKAFLPKATTPAAAPPAGGAQAVTGGIHVPGTNVDIGVPNPLDVATSWVEPLVGKAQVVILGAMFASAGLTLVALGLYRLADASKAKAQPLVSTVAAATGGLGTIAALA